MQYGDAPGTDQNNCSVRFRVTGGKMVLPEAPTVWRILNSVF
jgi:hypothetical protein